MKKYFSISALALLSVLCFSVTFSSCDKDDEGSGSIVGTWKYVDDDPNEECELLVSFYSNGEVLDGWFCNGEITSDSSTGTWSVDGDILFLDGDAEYRFRIKGNKLYLYDIEDEDDYDIYVRVK